MTENREMVFGHFQCLSMQERVPSGTVRTHPYASAVYGIFAGALCPTHLQMPKLIGVEALRSTEWRCLKNTGRIGFLRETKVIGFYKEEDRV